MIPLWAPTRAVTIVSLILISASITSSSTPGEAHDHGIGRPFASADAALVPREEKDCLRSDSRIGAAGSCLHRPATETHEVLNQTNSKLLGFIRRRGLAGHHSKGGHHWHWVHHRRPHGRLRRRRRDRGRRHGRSRRRSLRRAHRVRVGRQNAAFNVMDFGAVGDGVTDDSQAFLHAWSGACRASGTALLAIPAGLQFLVGPMLLLDGTNCTAGITMMVHGEIIAPQDPDLWGALGDSKWIYIHDVRNFILTGSGTINGRGQIWWEHSCKTNPFFQCRSVPRAITFKRATNVVVTGLKFLNSQAMHLDFDNCNGVYAADLTITAPGTSPNTDGIHLQNTVNAVVQNCDIGTGDDCISIQTGCTNVLTRDIRCGPGHGISIGGLGKANTYAQVSNIQVYNVTFSGSTNGVRIKSWQGASGWVNNVTHSLIQMNAVRNPIIVDQYYCDAIQPCVNQTSNVKISNILYDNIWGTSATNVAIRLACSTTEPCENLVLQNIALTLDGGQSASSYCQDAWGTAVGDVHPPSCLNS